MIILEIGFHHLKSLGVPPANLRGEETLTVTN